MKLRENILGLTLVGAGFVAYIWAPRACTIATETRGQAGQTLRKPSQASQTTPKIARSVPPALIEIYEEPTPLQNTAERATNGDKEALQFVSRYFENEYQKRCQRLKEGDGAAHERVRREILEELGVTEEEFKTLDDAYGINEWLKVIHGNEGIEELTNDMRVFNTQLMGHSDDAVPEVLTGLKFFQLFETICDQVHDNGPYNPALLRALNMNEGQFRGLVDEVYQYMVHEHESDEDQQEWLDYLARLYGFVPPE